MSEYVKSVDLVVVANSEEEADEAFVRSGIRDGELIGEAMIVDVGETTAWA